MPPKANHQLNSSSEALTKAFDKFPVRWFEKTIIIAIIEIAIGLGGYLLQLKLGLFINPILSTVAIATFLTARATDVASTLNIARQKPYFTAIHIPFPAEEQALWLPKHPTLKDFLLRPYFVLSTLVYSILGFLLPCFAFAMSLGHFSAASTNYRQVKRLQYMLQFLH
jgi:hypothetical protein